MTLPSINNGNGAKAGEREASDDLASPWTVVLIVCMVDSITHYSFLITHDDLLGTSACFCFTEL